MGFKMVEVQSGLILRNSGKSYITNFDLYCSPPESEAHS